jgi:hypothetical protein
VVGFETLDIPGIFADTADVEVAVLKLEVAVFTPSPF